MCLQLRCSDSLSQSKHLSFYIVIFGFIDWNIVLNSRQKPFPFCILHVLNDICKGFATSKAPLAIRDTSPQNPIPPCQAQLPTYMASSYIRQEIS